MDFITHICGAEGGKKSRNGFMAQGGFWLRTERPIGLKQAEPMERGQELRVEKNSISKGMDEETDECSKTTEPPGCVRAVLIAITLRRASLETQLCIPSPRIVTLTVELPNTACGWYNIGDSLSSPGTPETQASGSVKIVPLPPHCYLCLQ